MKFRPLHNLIAIRMDEAEEFQGLIAIPVFAREELDVGTVVAAGPGMHDEEGEFITNPIKEGDRVLLAKGSGINIEVLNEELLFVSPAEVTGILK